MFVFVVIEWIHAKTEPETHVSKIR